MDLVVASNGDDTVAFWSNDGTGTFSKTIIYDAADFVLSVTAIDFDRDGDIDVASASYFDGYIRWYENLNGVGTSWANHTLYVGSQGHYVSAGDMDGDGDNDLIAVTKSENRVQVFYADTVCNGAAPSAVCCLTGQYWSGSACLPCADGTYGVISAGLATCVSCPPSPTCTIAGLSLVPATCSGVTGCPDVATSTENCDCDENSYKSNETDMCVSCPAGQLKTETTARPVSSLDASIEIDDDYFSKVWDGFLNTCTLIAPDEKSSKDYTTVWIAVLSCVAGPIVLYLLFWVARRVRRAVEAQRDYEKWMDTQARGPASATLSPPSSSPDPLPLHARDRHRSCPSHVP